MKEGRKVIGYVRVSRTMGREGDSFLSPALQREQIDALARREGLTIVDVVEELDASGGDAKRPGWNRAIEAVEAGAVQGIAVWNLSRFSRSAKDALVALDRIESAGGQLYSATEDFSGDSGKMMRTVMLAFAENERDRARASFAASTSSALERGVYLAGKTPIGYVRGPDRRLVPDPDTSPVVVGAFERRAKGMSWAKLARRLTEEGHRARNPGRRRSSTTARTWRGPVRPPDEGERP